MITGTGIHLPGNRVDNERLSRIMDTSHEWIVQRTGIETRYFADPDEATSDLALQASIRALEDAGLSPNDVDYIIMATMTPDYYLPGAGPYLQRKLGIQNVPCLDIRQQCAGFIFGAQLADSLVRTHQARNVLLVGAEVHSCLMSWDSWDIVLGHSDRAVDEEEKEWNTRFRDRTVLFGDGAGACIFSESEDNGRGVMDTLLFTDGELSDRIWANAGGSAFRPFFNPSMTEKGDTVPMIRGREVFRLAVTLMPDAVIKLLERNRLTLDDVDLLVMHQANLRINEAIQQRLNLPDERVFNNIQRYGNTTAATIPIAFHEARIDGRVKPGSLVCFVALGSGLHWGAVLYRA